MFKNTKLKLLLGSVIAIIPTTAVIACATSTEISDEDSQLIASATSSTALKVLEKQWMKKVLASQYDTAVIPEDFLEKGFEIGSNEEIPNILDETIKFHLATKLASDARYLNNIATSLLKLVKNGEQKYSTIHSKDEHGRNKSDVLTNVREIGIQNEYLYGYNDKTQEYFNEIIQYQNIAGNTIETTRYRALVNVLMSEPTLDFSTEVFKYLLVSSYLTMKYADWEALYPEKAENLSEIDKIIDKRENFELTRMLLEKKYFFKWELELDETKSASYIGLEEITKKENETTDPMIKALNEFLYVPKSPEVSYEDSEINGYTGYSKNIIGKSAFTKQNTRLFESVIDFSSGTGLTDGTILSRINKIGGYAGITSLSSTGKGKLNFTKKGFEEAIGTPNYWFGFYESNDSETNIVNDKIKYFGGSEALKIKMSFVFGLMPLYHPNTNVSTADSNEKLSLDGTYFSTDNRVEELTRILYNQDSSIYDQAFEWFTKSTDDGGKGILITVHNKMLREKYKELDIKYIDFDEETYN